MYLAGTATEGWICCPGARGSRRGKEAGGLSGSSDSPDVWGTLDVWTSEGAPHDVWGVKSYILKPKPEIRSPKP